MRDIPKWLPWLTALLIALGGWLYSYASFESKVDTMLKYNKEALDKMEKKVDELYKLIMGAQ